MYQTGYKSVQPLSMNLPYNGGFCRWWYTPIDNITDFPIVDYATQFLNGPIAVVGPWFGAMKVPDETLGFSEDVKRDKIGIVYPQKISGFYPGDDAGSRVNLENTPYYEFVIVGKMRAGGFYLVIGNQTNGALFDATYASKGGDVAGGNFSFSFTSLSKALILPDFDESNATPPSGYSGPVVGGTTNPPEGDMEIINYTSEQVKNIAWDASRQQRFGSFPVIQVWYTEVDENTGVSAIRLNTAPIISVDAPPPAATNFIVSINAPGPGFITISK